ncbi:MAG: hypothetical protein WKF77_17240 [Planctomycetaceae bacterium]
MNDRNRHDASSLGISSLILGMFSFLICWLPGIGQVVSGLGLLLGLTGLYSAIGRQGTGIGYAISGSVLNGLALLIGLLLIDMDNRVTATGDHLKARRNRAIPQATRTLEDKKNETANATNSTNTDAKSETLSPTPEAPAWHPATEPLQLGNIRLKIFNVFIRRVPLGNKLGDRDSLSSDTLFTVYIELTNTSENKKIDYDGWMSRNASLMDIDADLTDNHDNDYRKISFGYSTEVKGMTTTASIYPGKSIYDAIVFEEPVPDFEMLRLKLSAKAFSEEGEFRIEIPASMIIKN